MRSPRPAHGGRLLAAAAQYGIPSERWLDLSTGLNPLPWPVPPLGPEVWARLPEPDDGLFGAARRYYGAETLLPVAGSQAAIQALPQLRPRGRVGVLTPAYAEHAHGWERAGHTVVPLAAGAIETTLPTLDTLVLVNPNNPTGQCFERAQLLAWHERLTARGAWLVVDEAFMDVTPGESLAAESARPGLIVLRSLGKFFGLAGARVGFVLAEQGLLARLDDLLGPWTVAGPAREVARRALLDRDWQEQARLRLCRAQARLAGLLSDARLTSTGGTALFQWIRTNQAESIAKALARQGILVRCFEQPASLRFGLPGSEAEWQRLAEALAAEPVRRAG